MYPRNLHTNMDLTKKSEVIILSKYAFKHNISGFYKRIIICINLIIQPIPANNTPVNGINHSILSII